MVERLSLKDNSLFSGYAENRQRHAFALDMVRHRRVLDAGCGTGYGSYFLATNGADSVLAIDISNEAIAEARANYQCHNLCFETRNVETLIDDDTLKGQFGAVTNFENIAYIERPERLVEGAARVLGTSGIFIVSTPNPEIHDTAKPRLTGFYFKDFTADQLCKLLAGSFKRVSIYGQWLTHEGRLRKIRARENFEYMCDSYYNPMSRLGRMIKRATGRKVLPPPQLNAESDSFAGDYEIFPLEHRQFPWPPTTLIAVCE